MSRCELTGKSPVVKNLISHSNIKTKSTAFPNVQKKTLFSRTLNRGVTLMMATSTIRSVEHVGGIDTFILNQPDSVLSKRALKVKSQLKKKVNAKAPSSAAPKATEPVAVKAKTKKSDDVVVKKAKAVKAKPARKSKTEKE